MADHDAALVRHLATEVMGFRTHTFSEILWYCEYESKSFPKDYWNPLAPTTLGKGQAMEVWERAREMGIMFELHNQGPKYDWWCRRWGDVNGGNVFATTGPRAICEAVAAATGYVPAREQSGGGVAGEGKMLPGGNCE